MDYLDDDELLHSYSVFLHGVEFQNGTAIFDRYAGVEFLRERYGSLASRTDLPTPITCKSGGFEKQAQKNLEIRTSNLETSKICVK